MLPILPHHCPQCAQFLRGTPLGFRCGDCIQQERAFDRTYALFPYEAPIIKMISALKFQHQLIYAESLGVLLADSLRIIYKNQQLPDVILPLPLHTLRLRQRGFNQALEIGRPIAKRLNLPLDIDGVERKKVTHTQHHLDAKIRKSNVAHAFTAIRDYSGLTVAILDDVMTTGHTVNACAEALRERGADTIHIWCVARRG